jgi:hypothetical protein
VAFGELPSAVPVVVGDLGIDLPTQPISITEMTYDEKINARETLTRRAHSRYVDFQEPLEVFVLESGIVFANVFSDGEAALVRQFFGPDVPIMQSVSFGPPGPIQPRPRTTVERADGNLPLALTALGLVTVATVAGGLYWRRRIGGLRYVAIVALPSGVFVAVVSLGADRLLRGHPGFGRYQTAGLIAGTFALAFGAVALKRSRTRVPRGFS